MALKWTITAIGDDFEKGLVEKYAPVAEASTAAIEEAGGVFKAAARAHILNAGLGKKFAGALRVTTYPRGKKKSINAAVYAYSKIPYAGVFEDGATIRGKPMLWLPLDNVPMSRGKRLSPRQYAAKIGQRLYSMNLPGKPPMLVAIVRATDKRAAKTPSLAMLRRGRNPGGKGTVRRIPLYIGIRTVNIRKKIDTTGIAAQVRDQLPALYIKHFTDE